MSDDSHEMPDFDKPENIPLVVPDIPEPKFCKGVKKDGTPCPMRVGEKRDYCPPHDPSISEEQRQEWRKLGGRAAAGIPHTRGPKTPEEMLAVFAKRLDIFLSKCSDTSSSAEEILVMCHAAKAFATIYDRTKDGKKEAEDEGAKSQGWRMKGTV